MTIEELKQALEEATPGPWDLPLDGADIVESEKDFVPVGGCGCCGSPWIKGETATEEKANARLIVEAVNNLPALLKVVEAAQVMLDAIDKGAVDSEEIVPVPGDGPPYRFHEEWSHRTRKALEGLSND